MDKHKFLLRSKKYHLYSLYFYTVNEINSRKRGNFRMIKSKIEQDFCLPFDNICKGYGELRKYVTSFAVSITDKHIKITVRNMDDYITTNEKWFNESWDLFKKYFPKARLGVHARKRFDDHIQDKSLYEDLIKAIHNYKIELDNSDFNRAHKTTFETFLGAKSAPFWKQWVELIKDDNDQFFDTFLGG